MVYLTRYLARAVMAGMCVFTLALLLVACGGQSTSRNSGSTTSPVQQVLAPTATTVNNALAKTYTATNFTIKYPASWKVTASATEVVFNDPAGSYNMTIGSTANPNGTVSADQLVEGGISGAKTNLKGEQTLKVPATTMLSGQVWSQRALSGTSTASGQSNDIEATVLATNHPAKAENTRGYIIVYVTTKALFDTAQSMYFLPMLQSFKFTA